jgi:parvulin-like peptidyl-prolyl isomerase
VPTPPWESTFGGREAISGRHLAAIAVLALLALGAGLAVFAVARGIWEKQNRPNSAALQVDETTYNLRYFARRLSMYVDEVGGLGSSLARQPTALQATVQRIVQEELLRRYASELGLSVEPQELEDALRQRVGASAPSEGQEDTFPTRYQQELERTGLSDQEYRLMVEGQLLLDKALKHFQDQAPAQAESVRYRQIVVSSPAQADQIIARIQGGEDFAAIARKESLDTLTGPLGGEVGWMPRGALPSGAESVLFGLAPNQIGKYIDPESGVAYIFQVLEKDPQHPLDAQQKLVLGRRALDDWLDQKRSQVRIRNYLDVNTGDVRKIEWVLEQVYGG